MRHAAYSRRDENEPEIRQALAERGWWTDSLAQTGVPDLVCWHPTHGWAVLEVIAPAKAAKYRKSGGLTPAQVRWHDSCPAPVPIAHSPEEAIAALEVPE